MRRALLSGLVIATMVVAAAPAAAQDNLGDVLGTTILQNTLTQIALPQVKVPSVPGQDGTQQQTTPQAQTVHAAGWYCQGASKKRVGGKSSPFSQCVVAMKQLKSGAAAVPSAACKSLSHKHVKGMKKTPYSACVAAGAKLLLDLP